jgi:undecaprenyl-diphosphatase
MAILTIIILGIIQGVTEFLPVSSSGHVLIFSRLLNNPSSFAFDVLVSFGTLLAIIVYYRKRLVQIAQDIFARHDLRLVMSLIVATVPAVVVGFFMQDFISTYLHSTQVAIIMLFVIGIVMIWSEKWQPKPNLPANKDLANVTYAQALLIGLAQTVSLISGSSRSGVTILAALRLGFNKEKAAEWSFLMAIPVIFGASLKVLVSDEGQKFVSNNLPAFVVSNVAAFISGMLAIHVLLKLLKKKGLYWFGWYRVILAVVLLLLVSVNIIR